MININTGILSELNECEMFLLLQIASRMKSTRMTAWPSLETLSKDCRWTVNTTRKWRDSLIKKEFLRVKRTAGSSNIYSFINTGIGIYNGADNVDASEAQPLPKFGTPTKNSPLPKNDSDPYQNLVPEVISKEVISNNSSYSLEFENAWKQYNYRGGSKKKAYSLFQHLRKPDQLKALAAIPMHVAATTTSTTTDKTNFKPKRCDFSTYLSQARWESYMEKAAQAAPPVDNTPTEHDNSYKQYLDWVKENSSSVLDLVAQLSKAEFIRYKTEDYPGTSKIGPSIQLRILKDAHKNFHNDTPDARRHEKAWPYFLELIERELKSYAV